MNSRLGLFSVVLSYAILISACTSTTTKAPTVIEKKDTVFTPITTVPKATKIKKEPEVPRKDTINDANVVPFLTDYGKRNKESVVLIETRLGNITVQLFKDTPLHRASFVFLIKQGYFNTTCFHRIVKDFIVQGGNSDKLITRDYRIRYKNYLIPPEFRPHRTHNYGVLSAARLWENNPKKQSSPFEFYFIQDKRGSHHLDGEHTVFGKIISGFDTLEKIAKLETDVKEWPIFDVCMKTSLLR